MKNYISNRDLMTSNLDELFRDGKADCMYNDPPWGLGALKLFRTLNKQDNSKADWIGFLLRLKYIRDKHVEGPSFIETGVRFQKDVESIFGKADAVFFPQYGSKKTTNVLLCYGAVPQVDVTGMGGLDLVVAVLTNIGKIPKRVFDPTIGLGMTARACKVVGSVCLGNELNRSRMMRAAKHLNFVEV